MASTVCTLYLTSLPAYKQTLGCLWRKLASGHIYHGISFVAFGLFQHFSLLFPKLHLNFGLAVSDNHLPPDINGPLVSIASLECEAWDPHHKACEITRALTPARYNDMQKENVGVGHPSPILLAERSWLT